MYIFVVMILGIIITAVGSSLIIYLFPIFIILFILEFIWEFIMFLLGFGKE
jgi:hypothetical protein